MSFDPDSIFPSGPTTRRGLLSAFGRRAAQALPVPEIPSFPGSQPTEEYFDEEPPEHVEPFLSGAELVAEMRSSTTETGMHIWWLGQSGFLVQVAGQNILLDPYLSDSLAEIGDPDGIPQERHPFAFDINDCLNVGSSRVATGVGEA